jgi:hypothetical protein
MSRLTGLSTSAIQRDRINVARTFAKEHGLILVLKGDRTIAQAREVLAGRLVELYRHNRTDDWRWYENSLSYCNAVLPHALLTCGQGIPNHDMSEAGLESLSWLADLQRAGDAGGHFVPIGSNGFYQRGGARARFDQQPVEAQAMVSACFVHHFALRQSPGLVLREPRNSQPLQKRW